MLSDSTELKAGAQVSQGMVGQESARRAAGIILEVLQPIFILQFTMLIEMCRR